jgi:cation transport regulator ChaB
MEKFNYQKIDDLPEVLQKNLPKEAQEIYLEVYQDSWENKDSLEGGEMDPEAIAHRNGMHAVLQEYTFDPKQGNWHARGKTSEEETPDDDEGLLDEVLDFFDNLTG